MHLQTSIWKKFKKHYRQILRGERYSAVDFEKVYMTLLLDKPLDSTYNDHLLFNRRPERDLHIKSDWLLIYKYDGKYIKFIDTGAHSDSFG